MHTSDRQKRDGQTEFSSLDRVCIAVNTGNHKFYSVKHRTLNIKLSTTDVMSFIFLSIKLCPVDAL